MNVAGIGIDAVNIKRFENAISKYGEVFLRKIFTQKEIEYSNTKKAQHIHLAGKFAAKEAVKKALPEGALIGFTWPSIEILNDIDGKPYVQFYGEAERIMKKHKLSRVFVSISHTNDLATSNAMAVKNGS